MVVLDSHVWIWMHAAEDRLSRRTQTVLKSEATLAISVLSIWEAMVAIEKGRIQSELSPSMLIEKWQRDIPLQVIPVTPEVVRLGRSLPFTYDDYFDRLIAATAHLENSPLVTANQNLLNLTWLKTLAA